MIVIVQRLNGRGQDGVEALGPDTLNEGLDLCVGKASDVTQEHPVAGAGHTLVLTLNVQDLAARAGVRHSPKTKRVPVQVEGVGHSPGMADQAGVT